MQKLNIPDHFDKDSQQVDHLGLMLAKAYQVFKREMLKGIHEAGYDDLLATHLLILPRMRAEGTPVAEIVAYLGMAKQTVSRSLKELEKLGYVTLQASEEDRRAKVVHPTLKAKELARVFTPLKAAFHERATEALQKAEFERLMSGLKALEEAFGSD